MLEIRLAGSRDIRKKFLVCTKYRKFAKEVTNTYFIFLYKNGECCAWFRIIERTCLEVNLSGDC